MASARALWVAAALLLGTSAILSAQSVTITEFVLPTAIGVAGVGPEPYGITVGPDGALWFTEANGHRIGRITTAGVVTNEYPLPPGPGPDAYGIAAGPDGALWFTKYAGSKIGRITMAGVVTEYSIPTSSSFPTGITAGPDGALWFTEFGTNKIGRGGVITECAGRFAGADHTDRSFDVRAHNGSALRYRDARLLDSDAKSDADRPRGGATVRVAQVF